MQHRILKLYLLWCVALLSQACSTHKPTKIDHPEGVTQEYGEVLWTYPGGSINPAINQDGDIVIGTRDGLVSLSSDGVEKWRLQIGSIRCSPVIGDDETIYVVLADTLICAISPERIEKWRFIAEGYIRYPPAVGHDGSLFFGTNTGKLYALNPDGSFKWIVHESSWTWSIQSPPVIGQNGTIYLANNALYAISVAGEILWSYGVNIKSRSPAIDTDGTIYVPSYNYLLAVNPDGTLKWNYLLVSNADAGPVIGPEGNVYLVVEDANGISFLYAWNRSGEILWMFPTDDGSHSTPAVGEDGVIYFGTGDPWTDWETHWRGSSVYAVSAEGIQQWRIRADYPVMSCPAIGLNGAVYITTDRGLLAISSSSLGLADSSWPKYRGNARNTGSR